MPQDSTSMVASSATYQRVKRVRTCFGRKEIMDNSPARPSEKRQENLRRNTRGWMLQTIRKDCNAETLSRVVFDVFCRIAGLSVSGLRQGQDGQNTSEPAPRRDSSGWPYPAGRRSGDAIPEHAALQ